MKKYNQNLVAELIQAAKELVDIFEYQRYGNRRKTILKLKKIVEQIEKD